MRKDISVQDGLSFDKGPLKHTEHLLRTGSMEETHTEFDLPKQFYRVGTDEPTDWHKAIFNKYKAVVFVEDKQPVVQEGGSRVLNIIGAESKNVIDLSKLSDEEKEKIKKLGELLKKKEVVITPIDKYERKLFLDTLLVK